MRRLLTAMLVVTGFVAVGQLTTATPVAAATEVYQAVNPTRVTDTRPGYKIDDSVSDPKGVRTPGTTLTIPVAGRGGVPKEATAVTLNLTATGTTSAGYLRVYPCGTTPPSTSSLNLQPNVDVANGVFTKLGAAGDICIYSEGTTHVIVDITGYVPADASPMGIDPTRVTDTRAGYKIDDSGPDPKGIQTPGTTMTVPIAGRGGVPKDASAVLINLTATGTTSPGFLRVYPCGATPPTTSSLNLQPNVDVANSVFSEIGDKGDICIFTQGFTHVVIDITGFVPAGASPTAINPTRLTDTRSGYKIDDSGPDPKGALAPGKTLEVPIAGRGGVPKDASAVLINLTATGTTSQGYLRVYPCGATPPTTSSLNLQPNVDVANTLYSKLGDDGDICIFAQGDTQVIVDVTGYVATAGPAVLAFSNDGSAVQVGVGQTTPLPLFKFADLNDSWEMFDVATMHDVGFIGTCCEPATGTVYQVDGVYTSKPTLSEQQETGYGLAVSPNEHLLAVGSFADNPVAIKDLRTDKWVDSDTAPGWEDITIGEFTPADVYWFDDQHLAVLGSLASKDSEFVIYAVTIDANGRITSVSGPISTGEKSDVEAPTLFAGRPDLDHLALHQKGSADVVLFNWASKESDGTKKVGDSGYQSVWYDLDGPLTTVDTKGVLRIGSTVVEGTYAWARTK